MGFELNLINSLKKVPVIKEIISLIGKYLKRREFKRHLSQKPLKIILGSSGTSQEGWVSSDIQVLDLLHEKEWERYFSNHPVDAFLAEHVWEHLSFDEGKIAAKNCYKYLKPGGYLRIAVPDGFHTDDDYLELVTPGRKNDNEHKVLYNYRSFSELFEKTGFIVDLLEYFDESGAFHYKEWDTDQGMISRSKRFDRRNAKGQLKCTSIILDAKKPE